MIYCLGSLQGKAMERETHYLPVLRNSMLNCHKKSCLAHPDSKRYKHINSNNLRCTIMKLVMPQYCVFFKSNKGYFYLHLNNFWKHDLWRNIAWWQIGKTQQWDFKEVNVRKIKEHMRATKGNSPGQTALLRGCFPFWVGCCWLPVHSITP